MWIFSELEGDLLCNLNKPNFTKYISIFWKKLKIFLNVEK